MCLLGHKAIETGQTLEFPDDMKIDYAPYGTTKP